MHFSASDLFCAELNTNLFLINSEIRMIRATQDFIG